MQKTSGKIFIREVKNSVWMLRGRVYLGRLPMEMRIEAMLAVAEDVVEEAEEA